MLEYLLYSFLGIGVVVLYYLFRGFINLPPEE